MQAPKWGSFIGLALTIGLACILTVGLLWWAGERASQAGHGVGAFTKVEAVDSPMESLAHTYGDDISTTWVPTDPPTSTFVSENQETVWSITPYSVVITIPPYAFSNQGKGAVITFTPYVSLSASISDPHSLTLSA